MKKAKTTMSKSKSEVGLKGKNKETETISPIIKRIFPEPNTNVYLHSPTKRNLAYIIIFLQRIVGKENVVYNKPWYSEKRGKWVVEVGVRIPEAVIQRHSIVSKEINNQTAQNEEAEQ